MANLASTAVSIIRAWSEGGLTGKERTAMRVALTLTGQGDGTDTIPASAFGLQKFEECSNFVSDTEDELVLAAISADGAAIRLYNIVQAADDDRNNRVTFTGQVITGVVKGYR